MPSVRIKDHWREQRLFDQRALIGAVVIGLATLGLIARLYVLQVARHDYYSDLSQGNRVRTEPIPAVRGLILDRSGELIAGSQPAYQLELVPEEVADIGKTLDTLVELGLIRAEDVGELRRTIDSSRGFDSVPIRLRMSDEDVARFAVRRFDSGPGHQDPLGALCEQDLAVRSVTSGRSASRTSSTSIAPPTPAPRSSAARRRARFEQAHGTNGYREVLVNAQGRSVDRPGAFVPT
jgi:penicillin-binding protein 2